MNLWDAGQAATVAGAGGAALSLAATGNGTPQILMVHATGFCKEMWGPVVENLVPPSVAFDQRCHGDSAVTEPPYDWWDLGRDVGAIVAHLGSPDGLVGLGHSSGGAALAMAEILSPGTFARLVLVEPVIFPPPFRPDPSHPLVEATLRRRPGFADRNEAAASFRGRPPFERWADAALDAYVDFAFHATEDGWMLKCPPAVEAQWYLAAPARGAWERLGEIGCPVTLVFGADSVADSAHHRGELARRFADAELRVIAGATHFLPMELPGKVAAIVSERM